MPEGHAIGWIDAGHGVVPPATSVVGLVAAAIEHCSFPLSEVTWRVGVQDARHNEFPGNMLGLDTE